MTENLKREVRNPFICILHPFDQFYELRHYGGGSALYVALILIAWFLAAVMQRQNTGYIFNYNNTADLNILIILAKTAGLFVLWTVGNWTVSIFSGGIGHFWDIVYTSAYCLIPFIFFQLVSTALSNVLTINEGGFVNYAVMIGIIWSSGLMWIGLRQIHDQEFLQTLIYMILTVLVMAVIFFLIVLFYTLISQLVIFLQTVYKEILFRI